MGFQKQLGKVVGVTHHLLGIAYYSYQLVLISGLVGALLGFALLGYLPLIAIFLFVSSFIGICVGVHHWFSEQRSRSKRDNPQVEVIREITTYIIGRDDHYVTKTYIKLKCLQSGVSEYSHKFIWSGYGTMKSSVSEKDFSSTITNEPHGTRKKCTVVFDHPRKRGDVFEITYQIELHDIERIARPFYAQNIHKPVREGLTLIVQFENEAVPKRYVQRKFLSRDTDISYSKKDFQTGPLDREIRWDIGPPKLGHRYHVTWE